jgi:hypothetical protein
MEEFPSRTTKSRFHLNVKVVNKKFSYRELQSRGKEWNEVADAVLLIPEQTMESDLFFNAWLPDKLTEEEKTKYALKDYSEVVMEMGNPICGYFRGALCHANHLIDRPHIFVMTKLAEEKLRPMKGKKLRAIVIGEDEEEVLYGDLKPETRSPIEGLE